MNARTAITFFAGALVAGFAFSAGASFAQLRPVAMLDQLQDGAWEVRLRDAPGRPRRICLRDARKLIQLRHPGQSCSSVVVEDTPEAVTVQYTCRGQGYGRTHVRREADNLAQIDSQGIARGLPFSFAAEARRVGACRN
jgi:hypothetical protein